MPLFLDEIKKNWWWYGCSPIMSFFLYCPCLASIHEKANCIAIFWTGRPHSLGSCHLRGLWATCFPHKGGGVPLCALPKEPKVANAQLKHIEAWLSANKLTLNTDKTLFVAFRTPNSLPPPAALSIQFKNKHLKRVNSCKFLG